MFYNGLVVDLRTKELFDLFCGDFVHKFVSWSPDGNLLAYPVANDN
jgi:hypothetical protein